MRLALIVIALLLCASAFATKPKTEPSAGVEAEANADARAFSEANAKVYSENENRNRVNSVNSNRAYSGTGGDAQADGGNANAAGGYGVGIGAGGDSDSAAEANNTLNNTIEGDTNNVTVEGDEADTYIYDFPSAPAFAPQSSSDIDCRSIIGFAGTTREGSISLGIPVPRWASRRIKDCEREKAAADLKAMGLTLPALQMHCDQKVFVERYGDDNAKCVEKLLTQKSCEAQLDAMQDELVSLRLQMTTRAKETEEIRRRMQSQFDKCVIK